MKNKKGSVILKIIKIDKHKFNLEIYPRLVDWEIFPHNYDAALYASFFLVNTLHCLYVSINSHILNPSAALYNFVLTKGSGSGT